MATKDELHTLAMSLFDNAKDDLARDGSGRWLHQAYGTPPGLHSNLAPGKFLLRYG